MSSTSMWCQMSNIPCRMPYIHVSPIHLKKCQKNIASWKSSCTNRCIRTRDYTFSFSAFDFIKLLILLFRSTTSDFSRTQPTSHYPSRHLPTLCITFCEQFARNLTLRYRQLSSMILRHSMSPNQLYTVQNPFDLDCTVRLSGREPTQRWS